VNRRWRWHPLATRSPLARSQVREINTKPIITGMSLEREPMRQHFARRMAEGLERLAAR
jgi:hypothetical protein